MRTRHWKAEIETRLRGYVLSPRGIMAFLSRLPANARVLDVGCGNNAPYEVKSRFPSLHYTGIDVGDYNQTKPNLADEYLVTDSEGFASTLETLDPGFDAVISSHNLEHCVERFRVLRAMVGLLRPGGRGYLAFPSERTAELPSREGTLNYHDDPTHLDQPPGFSAVIAEIQSCGGDILVAKPMYRPLIHRALGWLNEPASRRSGRVLQGTWAYHGFESLIWFQKKG